MTTSPVLFALWLVLGLVLGILFVAFAQTRRKGALQVLAIGLVVAALVYVGFAAYGGAPRGLLIEGAGLLLYGGFAVLGLRHAPRWLAAGWALHPLWDLGLHLQGAGADYTPLWYVLVCLSFDVVVAAYIALRYAPPPAEAPQP